MSGSMLSSKTEVYLTSRGSPVVTEGGGGGGEKEIKEKIQRDLRTSPSPVMKICLEV